MKITIVMPVYNTKKYVDQAIQSILNQSFQDFEFIIIDDGSTDKSLSIIKSFNDKRIQIIQNKKNLGLIKTLNKGIDLAKGKYIARMDADDIAKPERLAKQLRFLEKHTNYALVGTQANFIFGDKLSNSQFHMEINSDLLAALSLFNCPFIHPSVMIRTDILKEFYYEEGFTAAEDYELWTRILRKYSCANLTESLLNYRLHDNNISTVQNNKQIESIKRIYRSNLEYIRVPYREADLDIYLKISGSYQRKITLADLKNIESWLLKMRTHLLKENLYDKNVIQEVIQITWFRLCLKNVKYILLKGYFIYLKSSLIKGISTKKNIHLLLHTIGNYPMIRPVYNLLKKYFLATLKIKN
jgi:glycosyltransferase involved in cell wall biosynthesis